MHAITIPEPGGPEALVWAEVPDPVPGEGEVLVDVVSSAVNRADVLQRQGFYNPPPGASPTRVWSARAGSPPSVPASPAGRSATRCVRCWPHGGYAEKVAVPAGQLLPVPAGLDLVLAAALPEVTATVWSNVFMVAHLRPTETLLVHGGSSGIGTMAIQLAKAVGARVAVTAGGPGKLARCAELGADILIDYREQDFVEELGKATDGAGADVILDIIGAKYLDRNVQALAVNGRLRDHRSPGRCQGRTQPGRPAEQAGRRHRDLAARASARREVGDRRGRTRARLAAHRRRRRAAGGGPYAADAGRGRSAPGDGVQHAHRQGAAPVARSGLSRARPTS